MSIRKIEFVVGEYYHIYNRGNSKQSIFLDDQDRERFLKLLYLCNSKERIDFSNDIVKKKMDAWNFEKGESIVDISAWVLMPNHFHLYITPKTEARLPSGNAITDFLHRVLTSYSKYFNARHQRTGSLFEGKFKSVYINNDTQAKYLFSYIHLNPIKLIDSKWKENGIKDIKKSLDFLSKYKWSSYNDYLNQNRQESNILNVSDFPKYFSNIKDFNKEILDWLEYKEK